jgi:C6 transcription factor Pro1
MTNGLQVLKGGTGSWHTHLRGAPTLFPFLQTYCGAVPQQPGDSTVFHPCAGNTIQSPSLPTSLDTSAMEFFSAAILYLDILACASTGMPPQYPHICADALSDGNSVIQLDQIIGCENWVMLIIRDIGVLDGWKKTRIAQNFPYIEELGIRANAIEHRLYDGIQRSISVLSQFGPSTASQELLSGGVDFKNINIHIVTHLYALSTRVYIHVIIHGPDCGSLPLQERVAQSIAAFHNLPDPKLLRSLVWPFCITGCMATSDEQQQFLTDICHSVTTNGGGVGTLKSALDVMEKCWEMRKEEGIKSQGCDWLRAMERLGNKVLLV